MTKSSIQVANHSDEHSVISTLVMAFSADPAVRWAYPDPHQYLAHFPNFAKSFGGKAFAHGSAHVIAGRAGAALWLPPGVEPDEEELGTLLGETVASDIRDDIFSMFDQMGSYHPAEPHWYLPLIGVDGPFQGQGYGSALLRYALAVCDRDQTPAYLESSNPKTVSLYQRHGFELMGAIQVGTSPQIFPMLRNPSAIN